MQRLDVAAVKAILHSIGNDVTKLEHTKKQAIYDRSLEDLNAHVLALSQLVQAPLARGTLEMPKLDAAGGAVPEHVPAEEAAPVPVSQAGQADDFSEAPTLTGREA